MTAHPKLDPKTGELITFRADWSEPWLRYGVIDASGQHLVNQVVDVPGPSMMHDIPITETHSLFFDMNVAYDFSMLERGHRMPLRWFDERESRIGVIPRKGGEVQWLPIDPCFIQHVVNAWDSAPNQIVVDVARYPWYFREQDGAFLPQPLAVLWRYRIDLTTGSVSEEALSDLNIELPRFNESLTGRENRYFYAVEQPTAEEMRGLVRYDLQTGEVQRHSVTPGDQNSEPVFVPRPDASTEDDGWVLVCVYRTDTDTTDLRIIDAADLSSTLAVVSVPRRIPAGFHGAWINAAR